MEIFVGLFIIVICCMVIWRASEGFEKASIYLGRKLSDGVRGATINAIGSSMPELFTTIFFFTYFFYFKEDPSEANNGFAGGIGTTAGSAIFNSMIIPSVVILTVISSGLAKRIQVSKKVILRDGLSLIIAEIILIFLISDTVLYWWHGMLLMATYALYLFVLFRTMSPKELLENNLDNNFYRNHDPNPVWRNLLLLRFAPLVIRKKINTRNAWYLLIITMLVIGLACFFLVWSCEYTAIAMGIKPYFVAVILASAATSVPDTFLSYRDAQEGEYDDAVANALGSNIFDVCFALGLPLFFFALVEGGIKMSPGTVDDVTELRILLLALTIIAFFIFYIGRNMGRSKAVLLLGLYTIFSIYIFGRAYSADWATHIGQFLRSILN